MKVFSLVLSLLPLLLSAQEIGVNHFERKIDLSEIFLPSEDFNSSPYQIPFPDSLYSFAEINLKKVKLPNTKVRAQFTITNNQYNAIKITVKKGKKRSGLLTLLEKKLGSSISESEVQCFEYNDTVIKLTVRNAKRKYYYTFTLDTCETN